jgi:hypothetical protein
MHSSLPTEPADQDIKAVDPAKLGNKIGGRGLIVSLDQRCRETAFGRSFCLAVPELTARTSISYETFEELGHLLRKAGFFN